MIPEHWVRSEPGRDSLIGKLVNYSPFVLFTIGHALLLLLVLGGIVPVTIGVAFWKGPVGVIIEGIFPVAFLVSVMLVSCRAYLRNGNIPLSLFASRAICALQIAQQLFFLVAIPSTLVPEIYQVYRKNGSIFLILSLTCLGLIGVLGVSACVWWCTFGYYFHDRYKKSLNRIEEERFGTAVRVSIPAFKICGHFTLFVGTTKYELRLPDQNNPDQILMNTRSLTVEELARYTGATGFEWITIGYTHYPHEELKRRFESCMKNFGTYDKLTNNCRHFLRDASEEVLHYRRNSWKAWKGFEEASEVAESIFQILYHFIQVLVDTQLRDFCTFMARETLGPGWDDYPPGTIERSRAGASVSYRRSRRCTPDGNCTALTCPHDSKTLYWHLPTSYNTVSETEALPLVDLTPDEPQPSKEPRHRIRLALFDYLPITLFTLFHTLAASLTYQLAFLYAIQVPEQIIKRFSWLWCLIIYAAPAFFLSMVLLALYGWVMRTQPIGWRTSWRTARLQKLGNVHCIFQIIILLAVLSCFCGLFTTAVFIAPKSSHPQSPTGVLNVFRFFVIIAALVIPSVLAWVIKPLIYDYPRNSRYRGKLSEIEKEMFGTPVMISLLCYRMYGDFDIVIGPQRFKMQVSRATMQATLFETDSSGINVDEMGFGHRSFTVGWTSLQPSEVLAILRPYIEKPINMARFPNHWEFLFEILSNQILQYFSSEGETTRKIGPFIYQSGDPRRNGWWAIVSLPFALWSIQFSEFFRFLYCGWFGPRWNQVDPGQIKPYPSSRLEQARAAYGIGSLVYYKGMDAPFLAPPSHGESSQVAREEQSSYSHNEGQRKQMKAIYYWKPPYAMFKTRQGGVMADTIHA